MLIGNQSVLNKSWARFLCGTATAGAYAGQTRANFKNPIVSRGLFNFFPNNTSVPNAYEPGVAFVMAIKSGGLASTTIIGGTGALTATGLSVRLSTATIDGAGSVTAGLGVITKGESAITGAGSLTATIQAAANMAAAISAGGSVSADLSSLIPIAASLSASASLTVNLTGTNRLEADITPFTELSPTSLAQAVLSADVETDYNLQAALRLILSATAGKVSGAETTTITFRNVTDDKDRIIATVDANGNRTSLTYDVGD